MPVLDEICFSSSYGKFRELPIFITLTIVEENMLSLQKSQLESIVAGRKVSASLSDALDPTVCDKAAEKFLRNCHRQQRQDFRRDIHAERAILRKDRRRDRREDRRDHRRNKRSSSFSLSSFFS